MFGFIAKIEKRKLRWVIVPIIFGIIYFVVAVSIIKYLNNNTVQFFRIYGYLGNNISSILYSIVTNPLMVLKVLARKECLVFLFNILAPLCFFPIFNYRILLAAPFLFQHFLSTRSTELSIYYHYTAEILPFIFISCIYSIVYLRKTRFFKRFSKSVLIIFIAVVFFSNLYWGPHFNILFNLRSI